ncbi:MAG TPA: hypothetical protein VFW63_08420 [Acidimicrobiales bacterium]|nr:hypothetical protein [Acidimicrobiales bacterium]
MTLSFYELGHRAEVAHRRNPVELARDRPDALVADPQHHTDVTVRQARGDPAGDRRAHRRRRVLPSLLGSDLRVADCSTASSNSPACASTAT